MEPENATKVEKEDDLSKLALYECLLEDIIKSETSHRDNTYQKIEGYLEEDFILEQEMKGKATTASNWLKRIQVMGAMHQTISELYALYHSEMIRGDIPEGHDEREVAWDIVKNRVEDMFLTEMS